MKVSIQTLGCKVNQSESASIEGVLRNNGCEVVNHKDSPDICIINTCTVTARSDYQSRQYIRRAVRSGAKVIATGCYAQLRPNELSDIQGLDLIVGNSEKEQLFKHILNLNGKSEIPSINIQKPESPLSLQPYHSSRSRAFLKIQDGCNFSCAYCTVPLARGQSRSLPGDDLMHAVNAMVDKGYREIVLTGIHIGAYGLDLHPATSLVESVKKVINMHPSIRIRISSIEPQEFDEEFIELMKNGSLCSHLHIPLQSGSQTILDRMGRRYSVSFYKQLINRIVSRIPDISLGTDVIAGFPGEDVNEFNETVNLIRQLPFSYLHVFPYSDRPHTSAADFKDQISSDIKQSRVDTLVEISNRRKSDYMSRQIGKILDVIVEKKTEQDGFFKAISDNYVAVLVNSNNLKPRIRIKVLVTNLTNGHLFAEPLE